MPLPKKADALLQQPRKGKGGRPFKAKPELDPAAAHALSLDVQRALYKGSYYQFFKAAFPQIKGEVYEDAWYQEKLCRELQEVGMRLAAGLPRDKHLIINVPPRSAKSFIFTVMFPVWLWLHKPNAEIMTVTAGADLAVKFNGFSKKIINSKWFQELFGDVFTMERQNETEYSNDKGGIRKAFGIGSKALGENADLILCDDVMDTDTAASNTERLSTLAKFRETIMGRFNKKDVGVMVNIQQRLHTEDVTGWLLANMGQYFRLIKLPSEAKSEKEVSPSDWFEHYQNGLIWDAPGRFSRADLDMEFARLQSRGYAQQHLQSPRAVEGGMFKEAWFRSNILTPEQFREKTYGRPVQWQLFVDGAETADAKNDATCYLLAAKLDNQLFVADVRWVRKAFTDLVRDLSGYLATNRNSLTPVTRTVIEGKSVGKHLLSQMKQDVPNELFVEVQPGRDSKAVRAMSCQPFVEGGRLWLLKGTWNDEFIDEVTGFTDGKSGHDDSLDVMVYAIKDAKTSGFWYSAV